MAVSKAKRRLASRQYTPSADGLPIFKGKKFPVYQALFNLNAAFQVIAYEIERLDVEAVPLDTLRVYMATAEELRSAMNHRVIGVLLGREQDDCYQFGRDKREAEEHLKA